tara:strand:- start:2266 stop:2664 length:399 start_codon:yes stop_codon:yes gene_type:complete
MKKFSLFMILFFFAVGLSFGQRSNAKESEKFYTKNWKVVKDDKNSSWSSLKPVEKVNTNRSSSNPKAMNSSTVSYKPRKIKKSTYPSTLSNNSLKNRSVKKSGTLTKRRSTLTKSNRVSPDKKKLFKSNKEN